MSSVAERLERLKKLKGEAEIAKKANATDVRAESMMIASHTGTRIRRGVVKNADGRFVTDTRDLVRNEGTLEEHDEELQAQQPKFDENGYEIIEDNNQDSVATTSTTNGDVDTEHKGWDKYENSKRLIDDSFLAHMDVAANEQNNGRKKQRYNDPLTTAVKPDLGFDAYDSDDDDNVPAGNDGNSKMDPNTFVKLGNNNSSTNTQFSSAIGNTAAAHEIALQIQKKEAANKMKTGVKHQGYTGVSMENEAFNRQIKKDYKDTMHQIQYKLDKRGR